MKDSTVKIALFVAVMWLSTVIAVDSGGEEPLDPAQSIETSDPGSRRIIILPKKGPVKASGSELRLPRSILPRLYDVTLLPILEEGNFSTSGTVDIFVDCLENTDNVTLHAADIEIDYPSVSVYFLRMQFSFLLFPPPYLVLLAVTPSFTNRLLT